MSVCPRWGLLWSEGGDDTWTCVGLYDTRQEAIDAFDLWAHVRAGRIVVVLLDETETRDVGSPGKSDQRESGGEA